MNADHVLQSKETGDSTTIDTRVRFTDDAIRIAEIPEGSRDVVVEQVGGVMVVRIFAADSDTPILIKLPDAGGIEIDNFDYQRSRYI